MSQRVEQLLEAALALPEEDRVELVEALIAAFDQGQERPFDTSWLPEIQRRSAEYDAGAVRPIPWSEVKGRARQQDTPRD
jgi:putative addiction module component (TIGR02574 family)